MSAFDAIIVYGLSTFIVILLKGLYQWKVSRGTETVSSFLLPNLKLWAFGIVCGFGLAFLFENGEIVLTLAEWVMRSDNDFIMLFAGLTFTVVVLVMMAAALTLPFLTAFTDKK